MAATATLASTSSSSSSAANDSSDPPALLPTSFALVPDFDSTQQESSNSIGELEGRTELSIRLRRATTAAHHNVRKPTIVAHLEAGTLHPSVYLAYLQCLYRIYSALEESLAAFPSHPHLCKTHHPALLARATALETDCRWYAASGVVSSRGGEVETERYCNRLRELAKSGDNAVVSLLLAHSYVRYLGDLSGGRVIARIVSKAYDLPSRGHGGASFYDFQPLTAFPSLAAASLDGVDASFPARSLDAVTTPSEIKALVVWFKKELNAAGDLMTEEEQDRIVAEASLAFELNRKVFLEFEPVFDRIEVGDRRMRGGESEEDADWIAVKARRDRTKVQSSMSRMREDKDEDGMSCLMMMGIVVTIALSLFLVLRG